MNEAETTTEELRELVREAHGIIKDLNREKREVRGLMADLRAQVEEVRNAPLDEVDKVITRITGEASQSIAKEVADITSESVEFVTKTIYERFDTLMDVLLGHDRGRRGESIPDLILRSKSEPKIDLGALAKVADPIERPKP